MCLLWVTLSKALPVLRLELCFHLVAWGLPLVISMFGLLPSVGYRINFAWCWLDMDKEYPSWLLSLIWEWLSVLFCFVVYLIIGIYALVQRVRTGAWDVMLSQVFSNF